MGVIMNIFFPLHLIRNSFIIMTLVLLLGSGLVILSFQIQIIKPVLQFLRLHT